MKSTERPSALDFTEGLCNRCPIVVRRRVQWGECDPAGVVFTPRFTDYLTAARAWFFREILPFVDHPHPSSKKLVYPAKALWLEFIAYLAPDDLFDMTVHLGDINERSFTIDVAAARVGDPEHAHFKGRLTTICVDQVAQASCALPSAVRAALDAYGRSTAR